MTPTELVAVWAHRPEDLTREERAQVEALLAADPALRAEADAMRALLVDTRALPQASPPASLGRDIAAAIDREAARGSRGWRAWLLRPVFGVAVAAAATVAVGVWVARREPAITTAPPDARPATPAPATRTQLFEGAPSTAGELADLDGFDDRALDRLTVGLDEELDPDAAPTTADDGLLPDPDLEWIDDLSSADVDSLDHYLDTHRSPT